MLNTLRHHVNVRTNKLKNYYINRELYKIVFHANDEYISEPFLHGAQIKYRSFGNYIFIENSVLNNTSLKDRGFKDFSEVVLKNKKVNLSDIDDELLAMSDVVLYNKKYNLVATMMSSSLWPTLNIALNIVENTDLPIESKHSIIVNTIDELINPKLLA